VGLEQKTETEPVNVPMAPLGQQINVEVEPTAKKGRMIKHHASHVLGTTGDPGLATIMLVDLG